MRILLINPPHPSIGSRIPREQLPPLGLLIAWVKLIEAIVQLRPRALWRQSGAS
jgi:hypothetical protein